MPLLFALREIEIDTPINRTYNKIILILWDEPKRLANIDKHGYDFAVLTLEFFDTATIIPAKRGRLMAINWLDDGTIVVVFVYYGTEALSVISMRDADKGERRLNNAD